MKPACRSGSCISILNPRCSVSERIVYCTVISVYFCAGRLPRFLLRRGYLSICCLVQFIRNQHEVLCAIGSVLCMLGLSLLHHDATAQEGKWLQLAKLGLPIELALRFNPTVSYPIPLSAHAVYATVSVVCSLLPSVLHQDNTVQEDLTVYHQYFVKLGFALGVGLWFNPTQPRPNPKPD